MCDTAVTSATLSRRTMLLLLAAAAGSGTTASASAVSGTAAPAADPRFGPPVRFSWDQLVSRARQLARRPHVPQPYAADPARDFEASVARAYGPAEALGGLVRLLPVTRLAPIPVRIHLVEGGAARPLQSTLGLFAGDVAGEVAGFRVLDTSQRSDWLAFQGASYFRASGSQDQYGLSTRGIAVDTGLQRPEEFPAFTDFWIEVLGARHVRVHALLDGPSLTGAYAFDCTHGSRGVEQQIRAALFLRRDIERLGIAPATSMFWYDEARRSREDDWRPEVHDSDGLAIRTGTGERIFRPLVSPDGAQVSSFRADGLKAFGLLQRDRQFASYQDDGAFYERRPNLWVVPDGDWGPGSILLYEMPTNSETADNVVAFWQSDRPAKSGERRDLAYTLRWTSDDLSDDGAARVVDSWTGSGGIPGAPPASGTKKFVVDFEGRGLIGLGRDDLEADINIPAAALSMKSSYPVVGQAGRWRVMLDIRPDTAGVQELRLFLRRGETALSETLILPLRP
ncbi:MAG: glucan biosynthesis protein D [Sphingomonas sp.]|nr:MAG: glucan biosynthesis protein D [Sphingomonas sp.]